MQPPFGAFWKIQNINFKPRPNVFETEWEQSLAHGFQNLERKTLKPKRFETVIAADLKPIALE